MYTYVLKRFTQNDRIFGVGIVAVPTEFESKVQSWKDRSLVRDATSDEIDAYEAANSVPGESNVAALSAVLQSDFLDDTGDLTPVSDLTLNLIAGHWYRINGVIGEVFGDSVGFNFDLGGGTATVTSIRGYYSGVVEDPVQEQITDLTTNLLHGTSAGGYFQFDVVLQVNEGGTFIPRFAQNVPDPTPSLLRKSCVVTAIDVTPVS